MTGVYPTAGTAITTTVYIFAVSPIISNSMPKFVSF